MYTKVVKFGGSSLADANQFKKVSDIILAEESRRFVVPSAPGKRFSDDTKVTDMLYSCYETAAKGENFDAQFDAIKDRYNTIIKDLALDLSLEDEFKTIKQCFIGKAGRDYAASRGEYLNGIILAKFLDFTFLDAADYIFFNEQGAFDLERTTEILGNRLKGLKNAVIPGFYGSMPNDTIKTFSRGGSDITGSIVARAAGAEIYENWTDVSGFLIADPRIVENPHPITTITYRELRELSYMGATVLHEDAIFPVRTAGIPINIRNTNDPSAIGTMIVSEAPDTTPKYTITGIAGKKGFSVINIEKDMMNAELGFGRKLLGALEKNKISFEHLPSGIDTMSVIVNNASITGKEQKIIDEIKELVSPDHIEIENDLALIAIVGRGMRKTRGTAARVFAALAHAHINIKMIDQGSSELNIIVGVSEADFEEATKCIYEIFVTTNI
ncbi:MAG TPA: aspartate kinase [Oscillospiraceae bacterium]|nr:aspartate kinase [Oscillospiraceae bacterium]